MKVLQFGGHVSGLTTNSCDHKALKKTRCSSICGCSDVKIVDKKGASAINIKRPSYLALDHAQLFSSKVTTCRKRVLSVVSSQSCSDCDLEPYNVDGRYTHANGHPVGSIQEDILELVKSSSTEPDAGNIRNELIILALPAIAGQAIDPLAQLMETAYIGRLGSLELASAGISVSIFNIISKLFNVPLLSITTSFVAEDLSKNASRQLVSAEILEKQQLPSVSSALLLAVGIGTFEALALFWGAGHFLNMMGVTSASPMYNPARQFLSLRALGAPANVISLAVQGVFRGFKDTKTPLFCVGLGNLSTVVLLPILVYSFKLGITGAAIATVASQYLTTFLLLWCLSRRAVLLPPKIEDLQFGGYLTSGGLLLGRTFSVLVTMTLGTSMAARQGPLAMAAHQIWLQVWFAVSLLSDALALSAQALIATSFAKCDYRRVKDITNFVLKIGLFIGIVLAIVLFASFGSLSKLFTKDAEVLQIVRTGVLFVSASQPINALAFIFDGLHYGVSDFSYSALSMMLVGALSSLFLLFAPPMFGLPGVWSGLTLFMSLRMVAGFIRLRWKTGPWWFLQQDFQISEVADWTGQMDPNAVTSAE